MKNIPDFLDGIDNRMMWEPKRLQYNAKQILDKLK